MIQIEPPKLTDPQTIILALCALGALLWRGASVGAKMITVLNKLEAGVQHATDALENIDLRMGRVEGHFERLSDMVQVHEVEIEVMKSKRLPPEHP